MNSTFARRTALCAALATTTTPVLAQETTAEQELAPIDNITIIGQRGDTADIAGSAHVIDAAALEVFIENDVMRVLRAVPGVYVQEEEGYGLRPNIGIRGSGLDRSARIALLEDGVLIAPAPYSAPSAYYFPTQRRMDSLEVLKGPASVVVGPRTTGGAINLISTPVPATTGGMIDLRVGEEQTNDAHLNFGGRGNNVSWLLETVQSSSDGFKRIDGMPGAGTGYELQDYMGKLHVGNFRFKAGYTEQTSDETYLGLTDEDFAADPNRRYVGSANDEFTSEHAQYQASYLLDFADNWRGEITAYRNDFERNWYKLQSVNGISISSVVTDPANAAELSYLKGMTSPDDAIAIRANNREYYSQGVQAKADWDLEFSATSVTLTAGFRIHEDEEDRFQHEDDYRMEDGTLVLTTAGAPGSQTNRVSSADAQAVFVDAEIRAGKWILTPGLRYENLDLERRDYSTADPSRSNGPTQVRRNSVSALIPGMGALYRLNESWRLLAGISKGYNPPAPGSSADEESSLNLEFGARYSGDNLSVESIFFINDYDNLVGTVTDSTGGGGNVGDQFDGGEVTVSGLELSAAYAWQVGGLSIPLDIEYTWTSKAEFENSFESDYGPWGDVQTGDELPYIPEHQLRASSGLVGPQWRFNLSANYVDDIRTTAGHGPLVEAESIDARVVWDAVAAWDFTDKLSAYVKVDNLFDETYIAARRPAGVRPGLPQTAYLGITYKL